MITHAIRVLGLMAFAGFGPPGRADDCAVVKGAMLETAKMAATTTSTRTNDQGKPSVTKTVQTATDKYIQTEDGKWHSVNVSLEESASATVDYLKTAKLTCRRIGNDNVNGERTDLYELHIDYEGDISDVKLSISSKNLILKSEGTSLGIRSSTVYDFAHVTPPANATPIGGR